MGTNLVQNVKLALESQDVRSVTGWADSTVLAKRERKLQTLCWKYSK